MGIAVFCRSYGVPVEPFHIRLVFVILCVLLDLDVIQSPWDRGRSELAEWHPTSRPSRDF